MARLTKNNHYTIDEIGKKSSTPAAMIVRNNDMNINNDPNNKDDPRSKQEIDTSVLDKRDTVNKDTKNAVPNHPNVDPPATNITYTEKVNPRIFRNNYGDMNTKVGTITITSKTNVRKNNILMQDYDRIPTTINNPMEMMGRSIGITTDDVPDKTGGVTAIQAEAVSTETSITDRIQKQTQL